MRCPRCGCDASGGTPAHRLHAALVDDDLDAAIQGGLLEDSIACPACSADCRGALGAARQARQQALAARDRFRARQARLARRQETRQARRTPPHPADCKPGGPPRPLPAAAAAALARARAKAARRDGR